MLPIASGLFLFLPEFSRQPSSNLSPQSRMYSKRSLEWTTMTWKFDPCTLGRIVLVYNSVFFIIPEKPDPHPPTPPNQNLHHALAPPSSISLWTVQCFSFTQQASVLTRNMLNTLKPNSALDTLPKQMRSLGGRRAQGRQQKKKTKKKTQKL